MRATLPVVNALREKLDATWDEFRAAVAALPPGALERTSPSGWTLKEMLAHVAFWDETVPPFINGFYRKRGWGDRETWHGGDAFDDSKGWPEADVHNAREAAWARRHATDQVLNRLDSAHARVVELVDTLTPDELADERYRQYIAGNTFDHYVEHLPELR